MAMRSGGGHQGTHPWRPNNRALPARQQQVPLVDEAEGARHIALALLAFLELIQELEVPWHYAWESRPGR